MLDVARQSGLEVGVEDAAYVAADADLDQIAREVRAADQVGIVGVGQRAFERTADTDALEIGGHPPRTLDPSGADAGEPGIERRVGGSERQADDMDLPAFPLDRHLDAIDETHGAGVGRSTRLGEAGDVVVVGQREHVHAVGGGPASDFGGGQQPVRFVRMTMEIDVEHERGHAPEDNRA